MTLLVHINLSAELVTNAGKLVRWKARETVTVANAGKYVTNGNGANLQKNPSKKGSENETVWNFKRVKYLQNSIKLFL